MTTTPQEQAEQSAFGEFLAHLQAKGFIIGVDQHLRLQQLLARLDGQCAPDQVKTLLCPLFAASKKQQEEFYCAFEEHFALFSLAEEAAPLAPTPPEDGEPQTEETPPPQRRRTLGYTLLILTVLALAVLLSTGRLRGWFGAQPPPSPAPVTPQSASPTPTPAATIEVITVTLTPTPAPLPRDWVLAHAWRLRSAALLPPLLLFALWQLWRWRRRQPVLEKAQGRRPPFTWPIELEPEEWRLDRSQIFYQAARGLRRRQQADFQQLDLARTIDATIAARGYPSFRYQRASRMPEYLALIDRAAAHDHQARLGDQLMQALIREGLFVVRYFYDGDPRICRAAETEQESFLSELQRKYPAHRLLLLGDGARLLDPVTGAFNDWALLLTEWPERALLTPVSLPTRRERVLSEHFTLLPATLAGLAELAERYELPLRAEAPRGDEASNAVAPPETDYGVTLDELRAYLGPDGFRWLCACAVYPELQWELTLKLGQLAAPEGLPNRLDEATLWRLLRLPWFRTGMIPDEIRLALVRALDPALEREVRLLLIEVLERNPAEDGTYAADERRLDIAVQKAWLARGDQRALRAALKEIEHLPPGELERDYTLLRLLEERPASLLALVLPARFRKLFYPAGLAHYGMKWRAALMLALLAALLAWGSVETLIRNRQARRPAVPIQPLPSSEVKMELVYVPGGSFLMGSPESEQGRDDDEGPQHSVTAPGFYLGKYEVTQAQWQAVMGSNPSYFKGDDLPVEQVSWDDAQEFCRKLSALTGKTYRLPTEAEWEYACRAGTTGPYAGELQAMAWYSNNSDNKTHPVGRKQANAFGLFDMHGNVWEWCEDVWHDSYGGQHGNPPTNGSAWLSGGDSGLRVLRGGSWSNIDRDCRSAYRDRGAPGDRKSYYRFSCCSLSEDSVALCTFALLPCERSEHENF